MSDDPDTRDDVQAFRESYFFPAEAEDVNDAALRAVIDGAKKWIGGRRYSWKMVAANYLRDGRYHA